MVYRIQILRKAKEDMQKSFEWYNEQQDGLGERFILSTIKTMHLITSDPLHYQIRFSKNFRFALVKDFPFLVVFKVKGDSIVINSVFHTSKNPKRFL